MLLEEHETNTNSTSSTSKMSCRGPASKVHKKTVGLQVREPRYDHKKTNLKKEKIQTQWFLGNVVVSPTGSLDG